MERTSKGPLRDISLTTGGGDRHVRQNSPAVFCDPPYHIGMEIGDPPPHYQKKIGEKFSHIERAGEMRRRAGELRRRGGEVWGRSHPLLQIDNVSSIFIC